MGRSARQCGVLVVVVSAVLSGVAVPAAVASAPGVSSPGPGDPPPALRIDGLETYPVVLPEPFVPRSVEPLAVVDDTVTASVDGAAPVDGLPVEIALVDEDAADVADPSSSASTSTSTTAVPSTTAAPSTTTVEPSVGDGRVELDVQSLSASDVKALGGEVLALGIDTATGEPSVPVEVKVSIDYSGFRYAFGADWADRVQLVTWDCPVEVADVTPKACGEPVPVGGVVDDEAKGVLTASLVIGGDGVQGSTGGARRRAYQSGSTLGLASAAGTFAATTLSNSGEWQVGGNIGSFSYDYPIAVPPALNGLGPSVSLSYSSSAVDGVTSAVNSQADPVGLGWSLNAGQGFIERRYLSCHDPRVGGGTADTCFFTQNATISLNGHAAELVPVPGSGATGDPNSFTTFRLKDDPDWVVTRSQGTGNDWTGEKWTVTTPDGTQYFFGSQAGLASTLTIPVRGLSAEMPCYGNANRFCLKFPYRWMLDRIVDPYGNEVVYNYAKEANRTMIMGGANTLYPYDRGALLVEILYGKNSNAGVSQFHGRVEFTYVTRCGQALGSGQESSCLPMTSANGAWYPDVPIDLICADAATSCSKGISYFSTKRLVSITTYTNNNANNVAASWVAAGQWRLSHMFPNPGDSGNEKLWLASVQRVTPAAALGGYGMAAIVPSTPTGLLPGLFVEGTALRNRWDAGSGVPTMNQYRVSRITDDLGQSISATYTSTATCPTGGWATNTTMCYPMYASLGGGTSAGWGIYKRWVVSSVTVGDTVTGPGAAAGLTVNAATSTVAPDVVYNYAYEGAAHKHAGSDWWVDTPNVDDVSWTDWRGFAKVTTTVGTGATKTVTVDRYFQGMNGDKAAAGGTRTVTMARTPGWPMNAGSETLTGAITDEDWLSGQVFESMRMDSTTGRFLTATRTYPTWSGTWTGPVVKTGVAVGTIRKWRIAQTLTTIMQGAAQRDSRTEYTYDGAGRVTATYTTGFVDIAGDEKCDRTWYLDAATPRWADARWMNLVAQTASFSGPCGATQPTAVSKQFYNGNQYTDGTVANPATSQPIPTTFKPLVTASLTRTQNLASASDPDILPSCIGTSPSRTTQCRKCGAVVGRWASGAVRWSASRTSARQTRMPR